MEETGASESKRSRKQTAFFEVAAKTAAKPVVAEEGAGIKLADNPHFCKELEKVKGDNEVCKALHLLLFNSAGKKLEIKKNLRAFSGFPSEAVRDEKKLKVNEKKKLWTNSTIKAALGFFGLEKGGDRDVLVNRMIEYLAKPVFTKQAKDGSKKRKSSSKTSKKGGKAKKVKRTVAPSAYILFCKDSRPALREAQPELSMIEQTKALGAMWNALSAEEKEVKCTHSVLNVIVSMCCICICRSESM
jgi:hypothetical protein